MKRAAAAAFSVLIAFGFAAQAFAADVTLKSSINVQGAEVRLGDIFDGAGDAGDAVFGMAPGAGRSMSYSAAYVQAKAKQAGLVWANAENVGTVTIARGSGNALSDADEAAAFAQEVAATGAPKQAQTTKITAGEADLKRGDPVQIVFRAPGIQLIAMGKAATDARLGGKARAINGRSNKPVDGILVAPGRIEIPSMNTAMTVASLNGVN